MGERSASTGSIDLTLIAHEFGRHAAPGPLMPTNVVAAVLSHHGGEGHDEAVAALVAGTSTAAWCLAEPAPHDRLGGVGARRAHRRRRGRAQRHEAPGRVGADRRPAPRHRTHRRRPHERARPERHARVSRFAPLRVDRPDAALRRRRLRRRPAAARRALVGDVGGAADEVEWATLLGLTIAAAESVGAMQAAFDMTVEWAFDRYSFGRPLASYQALKHRFADMKSWLEASHAITDAAAVAVATDDPQAADLVRRGDGLHRRVRPRARPRLRADPRRHRRHVRARPAPVPAAHRRRTGRRSARPAEHRRRLADSLEQHAEERSPTSRRWSGA